MIVKTSPKRTTQIKERVHAFFFSANGTIYGNEITVTSVWNDKFPVHVTGCRSIDNKTKYFHLCTQLYCV